MAVDTAAKIFQCLALLIAGVWAIGLFIYSVKPGLELRGELNADLRWSPSSDKNNCIATLTVG